MNRLISWWQRRSVIANIRLEPPEPFDFKTPDEWEKWRRRYEQFRVASGAARYIGNHAY